METRSVLFTILWGTIATLCGLAIGAMFGGIWKRISAALSQAAANAQAQAAAAAAAAQNPPTS
jgi:hypothetical protein